MAKTLMNQLKKMDPDAIVKLGARDGTGFFYCGDVKTLRENLGEYSRTSKLMARRMKDRSYKRLIHTCKVGTERKSMDSHLWLKNIAHHAKSAYEYDVQHTDFKPLEKRSVLDVFQANKIADAAEPTVIIVTGYEYGNYWTMDEASGKSPFGLRIISEKDFDREDDAA